MHNDFRKDVWVLLQALFAVLLILALSRWVYG